jgi:molybdopterin molybdotransferase
MSELGPSAVAAQDVQISVEEARTLIAQALVPVEGSQQVSLDQALGRVLADDLLSPINVPAHDNSAMDGYAFCGADLLANRDTVLRALGSTVYAGQPFAGTLAQGECIRIMTGAVMPPGLDTVVPLELCQVADAQVTIGAGVVRAGDNRRFAGEDLTAGRPALRAGRILRPADVGLMASLGFTQAWVKRRLRVALFSTGNELVEPGQPLPPGGIYDSNRFSLMAALQRLHVEVLDFGLVPDDRHALAAAMTRAVSQADVVLTSGGVSAGDADYTREVMEQLGAVSFWKVAMRPGRPFAFGALRALGNDGIASPGGSAPAQRTAWLFALPGNPVAALVTFYALARDGLLRLAGAQSEPIATLRVRSAQTIRKRPGRTEFQRGRVEPGSDGQWCVHLVGSQGAGILRSMSEANALVVLHHDQKSVEAGDWVDVWLFDGLV